MSSMRVLKHAQKRDPLFVRKVFIAHYVGIPFHHLDKVAANTVARGDVYSAELVKELYAAAFHLVRNFELAPFASDTRVENVIASLVDKET